MKNHTIIKSLFAWCLKTDNDPASNKSLILVACFFFFSLSYVIVHIQINIRDQFGFLVCLKSGALAGVVLPLLVATLSLRMVFYYSVSTPCHTPTPKRIIFTSTLIFHILMKFIITCLFGSSLFTIAEIMNVTRSLKTLKAKPNVYSVEPFYNEFYNRF